VAVWPFFLVTECQVQSLVTSCRMCAARSGVEANLWVFFCRFLRANLPSTTLHIHLRHITSRHIMIFSVFGVRSSRLGWAQGEEFKFICNRYVLFTFVISLCYDTNLLTYLPTFLLTYVKLTYLITCLLTYLLTYILTYYIVTYLLSYLPT